MAANRFIYMIVAAFLVGNLVFIFIKYNSDKNIDKLIADNERLLDEFKVNSQLVALERDVVLVESKIRGTVATGDSAYIAGVDMKMAKVRSDLDKLQKLTGDDSSEEYIDQLDYLVREKLRLHNQVLDVYSRQGKKGAEAMLATQRGKTLTDSILLLTQKVSSARGRVLSGVSRAIDGSVRKVQRLDTFLIAFFLVITAALFWYILNTIRTQSRLIRQVSESEKKIKEVARVKENFLANMSHEIRTPVHAILGFTGLLQHKNLDGESGLFVRNIQRSGENLLAIINDILDLSKIEAGMMRIERAPFRLREVLHSVETLFRSRADEKGIQLLTRVDPSLPDTLEGDATRLTQILANLMGNAIKFTARGSVSVGVSRHATDGSRVVLGVAVSDTGIGIEPEKLTHIFDRFQQADDAVTRQYGGTGLGLSIVKELLELQGGSIRAESEPGKGTTFYLTIPYRVLEASLPSAGVAYTSTQAAVAGLQKVRILVVEDNEVNQTLLRHLFQNWKIAFDLAGNGAEALEKVKTGTYDLILMDIQMPHMDGYTATRHLREHLKIATPIIAMTAHAMAGEKEKCLSAGMDDYISKPIREELLKSLIARFVPLEKPASPRPADTPVPSAYQYIDLTYMKEVSAGNRAYEKEVTTQFIELLPRQLDMLEDAGQKSDRDRLRQAAHSLKTTVSVMGLTEVLQPYLDEIENGSPDESHLEEMMEHIKRVCQGALPEAKAYLNTLDS